jgi:DNA gyrase subunit B
MANEAETDNVETPKVERAESAYNADCISKVSFPECVRIRPRMYIGTTDHGGLFHLFQDILENPIDEVMMGHCNKICVTLHADYSVSVEDNGRGISRDTHPETGRPIAEIVMTSVYAGCRVSNKQHRYLGAMNGCGVPCANAFSDWMEITVKHEGEIHRMRCERGIVTEPLHIIGTCPEHETGTTQRWLPDKTIFALALDETGNLIYKPERFIARIQELAFLNKEVEITWHDELNQKEAIIYCHPKGVQDYVTYINTFAKFAHYHSPLLTGSDHHFS